MTLNWKHIMNEQPKHGQSIVQIDAPYMGHYNMGMREYCQACTFEEVVNFCIKNDISLPDYWWIATDEFPFPKKNLCNKL